MNRKTLINSPFHSPQTESSGYCRKCATGHRLGSSKAIAACHRLAEQLQEHETIDLFDNGNKQRDILRTDYLFGPARGKMFGVMECLQQDGTHITLRAFSGQYNGLWKVKGWVPPLFNVDLFFKISDKTEKEIKRLGRELESLIPHSAKWLLLRKKRRQLSQTLMRDIHNLYQLTNFHGETSRLNKAYNGKNGIPTGTGDCCAPKLLSYAAKHRLIPLGLAEFYWGKENKSASRQHTIFYSSCREKCEPILGFLLCGLSEKR